MKPPCAVDGCDRLKHAGDYCGMHYARWKRTGDPGEANSRVGTDNATRFATKVRTMPSGCIEWVGGLNQYGYGVFYHDHTQSLAHRWAYKTQVGQVPDGLELDHLCRNRACVNTEHLEAVTRQVNSLRGIGPTAINARKTHCPQGHPYSGANLYIIPSSGGRVCRVCNAEKGRRRNRKRMAARRAAS